MTRQQAYTLQNIEVWNPDGVLPQAAVRVEGGIVTAVGTVAEVEPVGPTMDGTGRVLLPAGVDPQVHMRVPGQPEKERAETALAAAVRGGVGALLTMPNTKPVLDSVAALDQGRAETKPVEDATGVEVLWSAAGTIGQKGQEIVDFRALADWGVAAFTDDGVGVAKDDVMAQVFAGCAAVDRPWLQHAEVPGHGGVLAPGPVQSKLGIKAYPDTVESEMVARDLRLLADTPKARYHVLHVSAASTLALVREGRGKNLHVTCEVSPHHLWFSSEQIDEGNTAFKMNPPLRSPSDRSALRQGLANGDVDFMATDHAPHEKTAKGDKFSTAAYGTTGLETSLRVLLTLLAEGLIGKQRLVQVWATKPAEFLGIGDRFGRIAVGRPMKGVVVDATANPTPVTANDLASLSANNCFLGANLAGRIDVTLLDDRVVRFN